MAGIERRVLINPQYGVALPEQVDKGYGGRYQSETPTGWITNGAGRKPNWLVAAVKKGAKLESFQI